MNVGSPNIVLILCDQLRFDYIGAYGCDFVETPNIDRLAKEGKLFENAYSPNPVCLPARHNLITGLTARHHGFDDNYFDENAKSCPYYLPTFAQILQDNKYETIAVGKMHFQPTRRATGFDFSYLMEEIPQTREEDDYLLYLNEVGYGNMLSPHGVRTCLYMQPQRSLIPAKHHSSTWVANKSIEYLRINRGQRPFMLWAGFIQPHPPFNVPDSWADMYKGKVPPSVKSKTSISSIAVENNALGSLTSLESELRMRELYAASISFVDHQIGRMLDELDAQGLAENTLVVLTSDHGEMLGDYDTYNKCLPYDASARIPMILRYPKKLKAGVRDSRFADLNDLLPTFLHVSGATYPADYELPGETLLVESGVKDRTVQYIEYQRESKRWCSLRDARYKYNYYYGGPDELFDLHDDPTETTNLLADSPNEDAIRAREKLRERLLQYEARYGLKGYVVNGDFKQFPPYVPKVGKYERNFPIFPKWLSHEESAKMNRYEDEILQAIQKEPTVKLRENNTELIMRGWEGFSDKRLEALLKRADEQGN